VSKGPAGYGRYDDDPEHVGCPWAKSDMTPCVARDGHLALSGGARRVCVGCGNSMTRLITDLGGDYPPARTLIARESPDELADQFADVVREATAPPLNPPGRTP
jgi:hypothetical protein